VSVDYLLFRRARASIWKVGCLCVLIGMVLLGIMLAVLLTIILNNSKFEEMFFRVNILVI